MPRVDFKPDVDGFAFQNDWTFDAVERAEIRQIAESALPIAAAALTPIVMAASPMIAPVAGLALGPVLPLIALAGPFLFAAAPKISELIVNAITDQIAKGGGEDDLCGGMTAAALDYHRLGWLPPRGNAPGDNPVFDPNNPTSVQSQLRRRIWNGQLESHIDNTPTVVLWKAIASVFGDWGRDWLRDHTRDELSKISAGLTAGTALPIGIVWKSNAIGHIVVAYALDWHGTDKWSLTVYDNERPGVETIFDLDLTQSPAIIVRRDDPSRTCDGIFLGSFRQKAPAPAVVLSTALAISPPVFSVHGEPLAATFSILNQGFGAVPDAAAGLRSAGQVAAPSMAWQLPMVPDPNAPPPVPPAPIPMVADLSPIALGTDEPVGVTTTSLPVGAHLLEPIVMAGSAIAGMRVPRTLPNADGSAAAVIPFRVNPTIPIRRRGADSGFGCARGLVDGQRVELEADLSGVAERGVQSVVWTVSGALTMTANGPLLVIASLPAYPGKCDIRLTATLADGTLCRGHASVWGVPSAVADRNQRLCELGNIVSQMPLARTPLDSLINPVRAREAASRTVSFPDVNRVVADLQRALEQFSRGRTEPVEHLQPQTPLPPTNDLPHAHRRGK